MAPFSRDQSGPWPPGPSPSCPVRLLSALLLRPGWWGWSCVGTGFQGQEAAALLLAALSCRCPSWDVCVTRPSTSLPWEGATIGPGAWPRPPVPSSSPCHLFSLWLPPALLSLPPSCYLSIPLHPSCHQQNLLSEASSLCFLGEFSHLPVSPGGKEATRFLEGRTGLPTLAGCRPGVWWGGWRLLQTFLTDLISFLIGFHIKPLSCILS